MGEITHHFHIVDELPHGGSVLTVDEEGDIHTYVSLSVSRHTVADDLARAFTYLARCGDYQRVAAWSAVVLPLTGLAATVAWFQDWVSAVPLGA